MTARHRPPSRARYAATHPSKTVHFDQETYAMVEELLERSGLTANQFIRQALGSMERHIGEIQERGRLRHTEEGRKLGFAEGYQRGYAEAATKFGLPYPCPGCGEPIVLEAGDEDACRALELLAQEGWGHKDCVDTPTVESPELEAPTTYPLIGPMHPRWQDPEYRARVLAWNATHPNSVPPPTPSDPGVR
jgi:hypothetical protein